MIKIDRKNHICELSGSSDEIFKEVQFTLHKIIYLTVAKTGGDFAKAAIATCIALAESIINVDKDIRSKLEKRDNSEVKQ